MDEGLLNTCSETVQRSLKYLESKSSEYAEKFTRGKEFYLLDKLCSHSVNSFIENSKTNSFWRGWEDYSLGLNDSIIYLLYFDLFLNTKFQEMVKEIKRYQTIEGQFPMNSTHAQCLRFFCNYEKNSNSTQNGVDYFLNNWRDDLNFQYGWNIDTLAEGIMALSEINFFKYKQIIFEIGNELKKAQSPEGYFGFEKDNKIPYHAFTTTPNSIIALIRIFGKDDSCVIKGINWLRSQQEISGRWGKEYSDHTADCLLAFFAFGEGPKKPVFDLEWEKNLQLQKLEYSKPTLLKTKPPINSKSIKEIQSKVLEMINSAQNEIRISSLYIDSMYEEIIDFQNENPFINIKILVRPKSNIQGMRGKIAKNVISLLNISTKGNVRCNELLHLRAIIVDNKEILISSADLTRDQLVDEFNAGIYVRDKDLIEEAITLFEDIWEVSEKIKD